QENAEKYYAKHKQRRGKLKYLKEQLEELEERLLEGEEQQEIFEKLIPPTSLELTPKGFDYTSINALRKLYKSLHKSGQTEGQKRYPYRTFQFQGYEIFVGKGAANNDQLSFKFANKEDLWLHAKDVTGSHVIIRKIPGRQVPMDVLEYAAKLAAYYSKRKTDSLVPVQYTPRKYIRKRKGDPPGLVAVDREEVILVEPGK
ncbi:MAG: NFACT RNA binding domain-containing protein, partial [Bacteroidota bacterium]